MLNLVWQLWKLLYGRHFFGGRKRRKPFKASERPVKPLHNGKTWKELFRIANNWATGNARTTQLSLRAAILPSAPGSTALSSDSESYNDYAGTLSSWPAHLALRADSQRSSSKQRSIAGTASRIAWRGQYLFAPRRQGSTSLPSIAIYHSGGDVPISHITSTGLQETAKGQNLGISELALDEDPYCEAAGTRLAVFYTNGQYSIFRLRNLHAAASASLAWEEEFFSEYTNSRIVVAARLHSPLLVTSSRDRSIRFRLLEERQNAEGQAELHVSLSQPTMRTHMSFAPLALQLDAVGKAVAGKSMRDFRVSVAYSTPYYPAATTVGVQVFDIHIPNISHSERRRTRLHVFSRSAVAIPPMSTSLPTSSHLQEDLESVPDTNQAVVTSIQHDGPYVVTSQSDNTISVYCVHGMDAYGRLLDEQEDATCTSPARMHACSLKIGHVRTLFGHTAGVDAVSLANGRCVSTGKDGLKVWELPSIEQDSTTRSVEDDTVWHPNVSVTESLDEDPADGTLRRSWLGSDSSKIVAVCDDEAGEVESVRVYDFE